MTLVTSVIGTPEAHDSWVDVCAFHELTLDRGVAALVHGEAVAVFCCWPDEALHAIGNVDPFSGASVLSRGIVGSVGDQLVVSSPVFKQHFDLRTGVAIEDPSVRVPLYVAEVVAGRVRVAGPVSTVPVAPPVESA